MYLWQKRWREAHGNPPAFSNRGCAPKRTRTAFASARVIAEIRHLRTLYPNLGKEKLAVLVKPWCPAQGVPCPAASTFGRIIARAPDKMRRVPARIHRLGRPRPLRRPAKPCKPKGVRTSPLDCLAVDTMRSVTATMSFERVRDEIRRSLLTLIDPASAFAVAIALPSKATRHTHSALHAALNLLPTKPQVLPSDNGCEFQADFATTLSHQGINRWSIYPNSPQVNAHVERGKSTLQESFVDFHENLFFTDLALFNRKWSNWLIFYSTQCPRCGHGQRPPLRSLIYHRPGCQRWWTHTRPLPR